MNNLLSNAIKFSFPKEKIVISSIHRNGTILLTITDHGIGMSSRLLKNVFDFTKSTSRKGTSGEKGTGFGMPLVKKFITAYGGELEITSTEKTDGSSNHGTKVTISLQSGNAGE